MSFIEGPSVKINLERAHQNISTREVEEYFHKRKRLVESFPTTLWIFLHTLRISCIFPGSLRIYSGPLYLPWLSPHLLRTSVSIPDLLYLPWSFPVSSLAVYSLNSVVFVTVHMFLIGFKSGYYESQCNIFILIILLK
jgi:hypothetical protein